MEQQPAATSLAFKDCNNCKRKNTIPVDDHRVTCSLCREKARKYRKRNTEMRERAALGSLTVQKPENSGLDFRPSNKPKKRKIVRIEYQTADGLYEALRNVMASSCMPEFHGRFSIIMDHTISHLGRARLVANGLRAFAHYPMSPSSKSVMNNDSGAGVEFLCKCLAPDSNTKLQPTRPQASLHSSGVACASDQSQADGVKLAEALQASFTRECKGSIRVKVVPDPSHPLGIAGQRISIDIIH
ncbi:hypothetical protein APHAL10511_000398 [Amanita phalloides]|nr:hypothetical protein APHAL10511_000398 [Amanita phalloides]